MKGSGALPPRAKRHFPLPAYARKQTQHKYDIMCCRYFQALPDKITKGLHKKTYSVMQDLYWGNLVPWERGRPQDPSYAPITQKVSALNEHFRDILSSEEYKRFEEMEDLETERKNIEEIQLFQYAFSMGVLMMIDVFNFTEKRIANRKEE